MGLKAYTPAKTKVNTPEQLAKAAMKQAAKDDLRTAGWPDRAKVIIQYGETRHELEAGVTVNVKNGQILFHFGAVGANRLPVSVNGQAASFGVGGNIMTGQAIESHAAICERYGLSVESSDDADLEAGETT